MWEHREGEVLLLRREPVQDKLAVTVIKSGAVVEHVPHTLAPVSSQFLKRSCNKGIVQIMGKRLNHGAGHGVEAQCIYLVQRRTSGV